MSLLSWLQHAHCVLPKERANREQTSFLFEEVLTPKGRKEEEACCPEDETAVLHGTLFRVTRFGLMMELLVDFTTRPAAAVTMKLAQRLQIE